MSVYRKDDNGNIKKIAGSLTQRINMHIFQTTHEFDTEKNEDNYIINESDAKPYISSIKDWTQYSINLSEPNESSNINIKLGSQTLKLINNVKNIEIGTLNGVIQCHTEKLDNNEIFVSNDYPAITFAESERQKSKNLLNKNLLKKGCYIFVTGKYDYNDDYMTFEPISVTPNSTITVSCNGFTFDNNCGFVFFNNGVFVSYLSNGTTVATVPANANQVIYNFYKVDITNDDLQYAQLEYGSVATDYQPYYGQITHSGDKEIEFAEEEYQKSKNLLQNTLEGFQLETKGYELIIYEKNQNVSYPLCFYVKGNTIDYPLSPEGALFSFTYSDGSVSYVTGTYFQGDTKQHLNYMFDGSKELEKITLLNWCKCVGTVEFAQLEENDHFTGYQPYNGEIVHEKEFYETPAITFAESERQKSKNLIPFPYYDGYSKETNGITFTVNNDQSILVSGTIIDHNSNGVMWLAWDMPLKAGTYRISDSGQGNDLSVVVWIGNNYYQKDVNNGIFTLSSDTTAKIYLQVAKDSTKIYNDIVRFMLCEGTDTDWQPYNGAIVHEKEFHETLQNNPAIAFAESERQKSKNLFPFGNVNGTKQVQRFISLPAGTYTLSTIATSSDTDANTCLVGFYNKKDEWIGGGQLTRGSRQSITVSLAQPMFSILFFASNNQSNSEGDTFTFADIQIEEGSVATDYVPYYGQISHTGDKEIEFARDEYEKSKNLLNATTSETTIGNMTFSADTSNIYFNGSYTDADRCMFNSWALKKGTYTLNIEYISGSITRFENILFYLYKGGSWTQYSEAINLSSSNKAGSVSFTLDEDVNDARLTLYQNLTNTMTNCVFKYQIVEGTNSDFDFQPYNGAIVHKSEVEPDLIYEMNTKNTIGGKPYTAGIPFYSTTISNVDLSPYEHVRFTCRWNDHSDNWFGGTITFDLDLTTPYNSDLNYMTVISNRPSTCYVADNTLTFDLVGQIVVNGSKNLLSVNGYKITYTGERTTYTSDNYLPYFRIEKMEGFR